MDLKMHQAGAGGSSRSTEDLSLSLLDHSAGPEPSDGLSLASSAQPAGGVTVPAESGGPNGPVTGGAQAQDILPDDQPQAFSPRRSQFSPRRSTRRRSQPKEIRQEIDSEDESNRLGFKHGTWKKWAGTFAWELLTVVIFPLLVLKLMWFACVNRDVRIHQGGSSAGGKYCAE